MGLGDYVKQVSQEEPVAKQKTGLAGYVNNLQPVAPVISDTSNNRPNTPYDAPITSGEARPITNSQLEAYRKHNVSLQFDQPDWNQQLHNNQSASERLGNMATNIVGKTVAYLGQTAGFILGAPVALATWDISNMTDNWLDNLSEDLKDKVSEEFPIYKGNRYKDGTIWDKLQTSDWWEDDAADRAALTISMLIPGLAAAKGLGIARFIAGGAEALAPTELEGLGQAMSKTLTGLKAGEAIEGVSPKMANLARNMTKAELFTQNMISQAGLSGRESQIAVRNELLAQREKGENNLTDDEISKKAAQAAKDVFWENIPAALISSAVELPQMFSTFNSTKGLWKKAFNDLGEPILQTEKSFTQKALTSVGKAAFTGLEHGQVENLQVAIGKYNEDLATGKDSEGAIQGIAKAFLSDFNDPNGQNNIALGTIQGILISAFGGLARSYRIRTGKENSEAVNIQHLQDFVNQAKLAYRAQTGKFVKKDAEGKTIVDEKGNPVQDIEAIKDSVIGNTAVVDHSTRRAMAVAQGDKTTVDIMDKQALSSLSYNFFTQPGGVQHLNNLLEIESKEAKKDTTRINDLDEFGDEITPERQLTEKKDFIKKFQKLHDSVESRSFFINTDDLDNQQKDQAENFIKTHKRLIYMIGSNEIAYRSQFEKNNREISILQGDSVTPGMEGKSKFFDNFNKQRIDQLTEENKGLERVIEYENLYQKELLKNKDITELFKTNYETNNKKAEEVKEKQTSQEKVKVTAEDQKKQSDLSNLRKTKKAPKESDEISEIKRKMGELKDPDTGDISPADAEEYNSLKEKLKQQLNLEKEQQKSKETTEESIDITPESSGSLDDIVTSTAHENEKITSEVKDKSKESPEEAYNPIQSKEDKEYEEEQEESLKEEDKEFNEPNPGSSKFSVAMNLMSYTQTKSGKFKTTGEIDPNADERLFNPDFIKPGEKVIAFVDTSHPNYEEYKDNQYMIPISLVKEEDYKKGNKKPFGYIHTVDWYEKNDSISDEDRKALIGETKAFRDKIQRGKFGNILPYTIQVIDKSNGVITKSKIPHKLSEVEADYQLVICTDSQSYKGNTREFPELIYPLLDKNGQVPYGAPYLLVKAPSGKTYAKRATTYKIGEIEDKDSITETIYQLLKEHFSSDIVQSEKFKAVKIKDLRDVSDEIRKFVFFGDKTANLDLRKQFTITEDNKVKVAGKTFDFNDPTMSVEDFKFSVANLYASINAKHLEKENNSRFTYISYRDGQFVRTRVPYKQFLDEKGFCTINAQPNKGTIFGNYVIRLDSNSLTPYEDTNIRPKPVTPENTSDTTKESVEESMDLTENKEASKEEKVDNQEKKPYISKAKFKRATKKKDVSDDEAKKRKDDCI